MRWAGSFPAGIVSTLVVTLETSKAQPRPKSGLLMMHDQAYDIAPGVVG